MEADFDEDRRRRPRTPTCATPSARSPSAATTKGRTPKHPTPRTAIRTARRATSRRASRWRSASADSWSFTLSAFSATRSSAVSAALTVLMIVGDLVGDLLADDRHDVRRQEEPLGVFERDEVVRLDVRVGAVDVDQLHLVVDERLEGERAAAVLDRRERDVDAVDRLQPVGPVRARLELGVAAEGERRRDVREVGEARDAVLVGELLRDVVRVLVGRGRLVEHREARRAATSRALRRRRRSSWPWCRARRTAAGCPCTRGRRRSRRSRSRGCRPRAGRSGTARSTVKPFSSSAWA